jgi:hypothetical protein
MTNELNASTPLWAFVIGASSFFIVRLGSTDLGPATVPFDTDRKVMLADSAAAGQTIPANPGKSSTGIGLFLRQNHVAEGGSQETAAALV